MFAVIKTGGKQYRVQEGDELKVEKLDVDEGKKVTFDQVLLVEDDGQTLIGTPLVEKASVEAIVLKNFKDKKVIVFKKKRRKQYKRTRGHRQELTSVKIEKIISQMKTEKKKTEQIAAPDKSEKPKKAEKAPKTKTPAVKKPPTKRDVPKTKASKIVKPKKGETAKTRKVKTSKPAAKKASPKTKTDKISKGKAKGEAKKAAVTKVKAPPKKKG